MIKVKSGDLDKMALLFQRYHRPLYGFLFHMTGQPASSEDMVQNVFYRMLKSRHTFTGDGEFKTWMYHIARNEILVLSRFQELKGVEIASILDISVGAVKVRIHRAINQLKTLYSEQETEIE